MNDHRIREFRLDTEILPPEPLRPRKSDQTLPPPEVAPDLPLIPIRNWAGAAQLDLFTEYSKELKEEEARLVAPPVPRRQDPRLAPLFAGRESMRLGAGETLSTLVTDYVEDRLPAFHLRGATVRSSEDAAALFTALRSPYVERLSWLLSDDRGMVQASGIFSVGTITGTEAPIVAADWRDVVKQANQISNPRLWIAHNHPSGDPSPSSADYMCYGRMEREARNFGMSFCGLVLNGTRFCELDARSHTSITMAYTSPIARPYEAVPVESLAWKLNDPEKCAVFFKRLQWDERMWIGCYLDSQSLLRSVRTYATCPSHNDIRRDLALLGSPYVIIGVNGPGAVGLRQPGMPSELQDLIELRGDTWTSLRRDDFALWNAAVRTS